MLLLAVLSACALLPETEVELVTINDAPLDTRWAVGSTVRARAKLTSGIALPMLEVEGEVSETDRTYNTRAEVQLDSPGPFSLIARGTGGNELARADLEAVVPTRWALGLHVLYDDFPDIVLDEPFGLIESTYCELSPVALDADDLPLAGMYPFELETSDSFFAYFNDWEGAAWATSVDGYEAGNGWIGFTVGEASHRQDVQVVPERDVVRIELTELETNWDDGLALVPIGYTYAGLPVHGLLVHFDGEDWRSNYERPHDRTSVQACLNDAVCTTWRR